MTDTTSASTPDGRAADVVADAGVAKAGDDAEPARPEPARPDGASRPADPAAASDTPATDTDAGAATATGTSPNGAAGDGSPNGAAGDGSPNGASGDADAEPGGHAAPRGRTADLFRESEIAADYVEGLLDILDLDGDIDELVVGGRPMVEVIEGSEGSPRRLHTLVGTRGATLEALQELSRLAVYRRTGSPSRLLLDVGGYRNLRRKELGAVAKNAAEKVKQYGEPVKLEPMSAFERKCVHDVINALAGVESESEGVEPTRRVVVRPTS